MSAIHYRYTEIDEQRVFYREAGEPADPTFLLLHGAPASSFMFRDLIPRLADRYHVVAPDLIGFGLSDAPAADEFTYTFEALTNFIDQLVDRLNLGEFAMYVQDYGAPVGWRLALRHPDQITAIVTQNGNAYESGFVPSFWDPLWTYAAAPNETNAGPLRESLTLERIRWQYTHGVPDPSLVSPDAWTHDYALVSRPGNDDVQLALYADYPANVRMYPTVQEYFRISQVPLLAVWGRNDEIFGPDGARAFVDDLPEAEVQLLDGGHFLLESHLDAVASLIGDFLGRKLR